MKAGNSRMQQALKLTDRQQARLALLDSRYLRKMAAMLEMKQSRALHRGKS